MVLAPAFPAPMTPTGPSHVLVSLQPDGRLVEARVANLGQGLGKGVFAPPLPGDEAVVVFPDGDPLNAIVIGSLANARAPTPVAAALGLNVVLMHPGGVELRSVDGLPAHGVVLAPVLTDLAAFLGALQTFMAAVVTASALTPATSACAGIGLAATDFVADPSVTTLLAQLVASSVPNTAVPPGVGAPPYASALVRATTP